MKSILIVLAITILFSTNIFTQEDNSFRSNIRRIKPSELVSSPNCPKMPKNISDYLESIGCEIPIPSFAQNQNSANAFQISFLNERQNDWAVLCSRNDYSSILIFWRSSTKKIFEFAKYRDKDFVDGTGYFRSIGKDIISKNEKSRNVNGDIIFELKGWGIDEDLPNRKAVVYHFHESQILTFDFIY
jgi:hypothetical protein